MYFQKYMAYFEMYVMHWRAHFQKYRAYFEMYVLQLSACFDNVGTVRVVLPGRMPRSASPDSAAQLRESSPLSGAHACGL